MSLNFFFKQKKSFAPFSTCMSSFFPQTKKCCSLSCLTSKMDGVCAVLTGLWWMMAPVIPSNSRHLFREQRRRLFTPPSTVDGNHCKKKFSGPFFASSRSGPAAARTAATANVHCSHHLPPHAIFFCMVFQKKSFAGSPKQPSYQLRLRVIFFSSLTIVPFVVPQKRFFLHNCVM